MLISHVFQKQCLHACNFMVKREPSLINIIHTTGGGSGGAASGSSGHAQRAADQFAQAHRVEAVDKGQLETSSNDRGEHRVMFTHHHRDAEVMSDSHAMPSLELVVVKESLSVVMAHCTWGAVCNSFTSSPNTSHLLWLADVCSTRHGDSCECRRCGDAKSAHEK